MLLTTASAVAINADEEFPLPYCAMHPPWNLVLQAGCRLFADYLEAYRRSRPSPRA